MNSLDPSTQILAAPKNASDAEAHEAAVSAPHADLSVLAELVDGDPAVMAEVLDVFRESAMQTSRELTASLHAGAPQVAANAAHKLRSAALSIGALRLGDLCAAIEAAARAGEATEPGTLSSLHAQFEAELDEVLRFLSSR